ncbi:bifunctional enoyl-CoA hydratase/phosphate acetyltransferase [Swaminathania salitolerans]|uniref:Phosphate acetyl/butyryl transferase n=1 Tax=Swaminathania salitolerans TaxID=182838 RepID=A0A511BQI5_9PROT|nr:bifunctional enoyl-CoA hydratase/phosphate acetyltransferase [Swaminathania salitolerans]GBQ10616.1 phosphate acetyl/butaryl transferase [Swaminathania salitolerans LMG 21291]GEL02103.1 phosphate acetyl/butyryl transferase [Swaminathania salitolerans]
MTADHAPLTTLIDKASRLGPVPYAAIWPCSAHALGGAIEAAKHDILKPILVGDRQTLEKTAAESGLSLDGCRIVDAADPASAVRKGIELIHAGEAQGLTKGSLHTDTFMQGVIARDSGLRTSRRMSHVFALAVPGYPDLVLASDAAINIGPDLMTKRDIVQNAIDLHHGLGLGTPRVALLSAVETINTRIQGTLDAASLCKMADRGEITGGVLDGPLAMDVAINEGAARTKGLVSDVAGRAQILIAPDLEAGNILVKTLSFMAGAASAGIVLGAKVPVLLTSRADDAQARLASAAIGALYARHLQSGNRA